MTARQIFTSVVKGTNFMTPQVIKYLKIKDGAVEISKGAGFSGEMMYGVTVVKKGEHRHNLNNVFYSEKEAIDYIKTLKK
jgi:hypothetical protein